jgi:cell wall-associated NlpC family hydrolase
LTDRSTARHRALHKSSSPLSTLTGSLSVVGDYMGSVRRNGVIIAMSSGLVASMALPASAVSAAPVDAGGPQTASIPVVPAAAGSNAFFAAPEGGLLALPPDLVVEDGPVIAPAAATLDFDHTAFVVVPTDTSDESPAPTRNKPSGPATLKNLGPGTVTDDEPTTTQPISTKPVATTRRAARSTTPAPVVKQAAASDKSSDDDADQAPSTRGSSVIAVAARYLGVPYRWGGTSPRGFDCSGYAQYVYAQVGKDLPRTVAEQRSAARIVPRSKAKPGDLVFFGTSHMGIYAGNNKMYDAPHSGASVTLREIYSANVVFGQV